jgi:hypothetical protein
MKLAHMLSAGIVLGLTGSSAWAATTTRNCDYIVYATVGGKDIELPNGRLTAQGKAKKGDGGSDERNARHDARDAAEKCVDDWVKSPNHIPASCKDDEADREVGAMTHFQLAPMSQALNGTLCKVAQVSVKNIDLMVKVDERGDKARECKLHGDRDAILVDSFNWGCNIPSGPSALTQQAIQTFVQNTVNTTLSANWMQRKEELENALAKQVCTAVQAQTGQINKDIKNKMVEPYHIPGNIKTKGCKNPNRIKVDLGDEPPKLVDLQISQFKTSLSSKGASQGVPISASTDYQAELVWGGSNAKIKFDIDVEHEGVVFDSDLPSADVKLDGFSFSVPFSGALSVQSVLTQSGKVTALDQKGKVKIEKVNVSLNAGYKVRIPYPSGIGRTGTVVVHESDLTPALKPVIEGEAKKFAGFALEF